ncbi:uncharacterized protein M421DRAFT_100553 [Didymella exigua CBS 183.55]|uniref:Uncharacterized protein n=1 Tax=Didymella exigua CBS 183.55 TaxID=1150837 RepID=A0A6A5RP69_9PLEO|nr:uncharacterized protein M421DRAFT_100553 [Didymella exigua CBS 183.55]KAF1929459.1 hypothetical protein M421DRAFT_100553 [Didymella exigua CBS 183.55]
MAEHRREASSNPNSTDTRPALPTLGFENTSPSFGISLAPPASSPATRAGYARVSNDAADRHAPPTIAEEDEEDIADSFRGQRSSGLGIAAAGDSLTLGSESAIPPHVRSEAGAPMWSPNVTLSPPGTSDPFLSRLPHDSAEATPDLVRDRFSPYTGSYEEFRRDMPGHLHTTASTADFQQYMHTSDTQRLRGAPSIRSVFDNNGFHPGHECQTRRDFYQSRFSWLNAMIIFICVLSTVLSGIFLGLALKAPRYGRFISTSDGAKMRPATAILWTSILAKVIELSFVTGFVAFLGQVLSRRAFSRSGGVTLSELSMWRWVVQPGTLITHWETAKYAGLSFLGMLSLLSAILATLYAPAATALVQPMLSHGRTETRLLAGSVKTDFANITYIKEMCQTPIGTKVDPNYAGTTCTQIEHAGQGFYNYHKYLADWDNRISADNVTSDQEKRPLGFGLLYENTTVTAQWVNIVNTTELSRQHGRVINSVSLAMPHAGVFAAARDRNNDILQPEELDSEGSYTLEASVPSPVVNVLCVNLNKTELAPLVYTEWNGEEVVNATTWASGQLMNSATTTNKTAVDDIFGWTKQDHVLMRDYPPVFSRFPLPFNTVLNHTSLAWGRPAIYIMGQGGAPLEGYAGPDMTDVYSICKIDVDITPYCSTTYTAGGSGGNMEAKCEKPENVTKGKMTYVNSRTDAKVRRGLANWRDVGTDWSNSLSLGTGLSDGAASNSRLLMQLQLVPKGGRNADPKNLHVELNPSLPSMAEAIAVLSGCTLLKSFIDAPFVLEPEYNLPKGARSLTQPNTENFNATIVAQQYASGGVDSPTKAWMVILILVFLMNIFVLIYFIFHRGLVTDFSEPPNLFALAVNSPPSQALAGSCGGGPEGKQYMVNWFVNHEGEHLYMEPGEKTALLARQKHGHAHDHNHGRNTPQAARPGGNGVLFKVAAAFSSIRLPFGSKNKAPPKVSQPAGAERLRPFSTAASMLSAASPSDYEMEDGETRTQRQYAKLSKRRSML